MVDMPNKRINQLAQKNHEFGDLFIPSSPFNCSMSPTKLLSGVFAV
jgi:hypothetical protein